MQADEPGSNTPGGDDAGTDRPSPHDGAGTHVPPRDGRHDDAAAASPSPLPEADRPALADTVEVGPDGELSTSVVIADGGVTGRGRLTVLRFGWHPSDALAVRLTLTAQPDHPALPRGAWTVLRDFLHYGLDEPTGDGEVRIRPDVARGRVWLELDRLARPACVSVPRSTLTAFLAATEQQVASGSERSDEAVDALLQRLLASD